MSTRNAERIPGPQRNAGDSTDGATGATTMARMQTPALVQNTARHGHMLQQSLFRYSTA